MVITDAARGLGSRPSASGGVGRHGVARIGGQHRVTCSWD
jgi:hypothetical protein